MKLPNAMQSINVHQSKITALPLHKKEANLNQVISALITPSKQISDGTLASNQPHPMSLYLSAQFVQLPRA